MGRRLGHHLTYPDRILEEFLSLLGIKVPLLAMPSGRRDGMGEMWQAHLRKKKEE